MINDTLRKIETELLGSKNIREERRAELLRLLDTLRDEIGALSRTHDLEAQEIAQRTQVSTLEATRSPRNQEQLSMSLKGLTSSVEGFEQSHPQLVRIVNSLSHTLSSLGI
jgi:prefoldin subunit 5